jgi:hypothetical protein
VCAPPNSAFRLFSTKSGNIISVHVTEIKCPDHTTIENKTASLESSSSERTDYSANVALNTTIYKDLVK